MKVLMVGPGQGKPGGILALTDALVPVLAQAVDLLYFPTVRRFSNNEMGRFSLRNIGLALSQYARFMRALARFRPHIVHIHTSQGLGWLKDTFYVWVSKLLGRRVVLHVHAAEYEQLYGKQPRLLQRYTRNMMNMADAIIAVSTEWQKALNGIVPQGHIHAFWPCLNVATFTNGTQPAPHANGALYALFLGTVGSRKGIFDLIEAMRIVSAQPSPLHLWIAGGEEKKGDLDRARRLIKTYGLENRCELIGTVQGERKKELLDKASIFVLPSYNEGLPFAVIEAMVAGLAIVATPVGGIPEVVQDSVNGFLAPPGHPEALAARLIRLTNDHKLRHEMGQRNHQFARRELDVNPYTKRLVALYESLLSPEGVDKEAGQGYKTDLQPVFSEEE